MTEPAPDPAGGGDGVPIPLDQLSSEALRAVVTEFVTRDGTELTDAARKSEQLIALLESGRAELWFDPTTRTCNILSAP